MSSNPEVIKQHIKAEAFNLGFCLVGISSPQETSHYSQYQNWIQAKFNAGMSYLATESALAARKFPAILFPECKSIISLGALFPNPCQFQNKQEIPSTSGILASYALGEDYHQVIAQQISTLMETVSRQTGVEWKWMSAVDTLPIPERELAVQAGLGWIGKNGMLNTLEFGSALFLSEIFINVALPSDQPFINDFCGSCSLCVDACPTRCINPDRTIDANRCLSYLTIEHRGEIPNIYHEILEDRIFGCDTCVMICPYTINAKSEPRINSLFPESLSNLLDIRVNITEMTEHFHRFFQHSAVRRAGKIGFLRNILIRLFNAGTASADELMDEIITRFSHSEIQHYHADLTQKRSIRNKKGA